MKAIWAMGIDDTSYLTQTRQIGLRFAANFDFEIAQTVRTNVFFQRVGQPVIQRTIRRRQWITETDRVSRIYAFQRVWRDDIAHAHAVQFLTHGSEINAEHVGAQHRMQRLPQCLA